jgi:hypothetical protein
VGSKSRITNKLRQNDEYRAIIGLLDRMGMTYAVFPATGSAHPFMLIDLPDGTQLRHSLACTPRGGGNKQGALAYLRRKLREAGYDIA